MEAPNSQPFPWRLFLCELTGTAALVLVGLSFVIGMFGTGSPTTQLVPDEGLRRLITGFLFGTTGASIALSAVGSFDSDREGLCRRMSRSGGHPL